MPSFCEYYELEGNYILYFKKLKIFEDFIIYKDQSIPISNQMEIKIGKGKVLVNGKKISIKDEEIKNNFIRDLNFLSSIKNFRNQYSHGNEIEAVESISKKENSINSLVIPTFIKFLGEIIIKTKDTIKFKNLMVLSDNFNILDDVIYQVENNELNLKNSKNSVVYKSIKKSIPIYLLSKVFEHTEFYILEKNNSILNFFCKKRIEDFNENSEDKEFNSTSENDSHESSIDLKCSSEVSQIKIERFHEYVSLFSKCISKNVDINHKNDKGDTALHNTIKNLKKESGPMVAALLSCGANANIRNNKHKVPLHFAIEFGDESIIKILLAFGAKPFLEDSISFSERDPGKIYKELNKSGQVLKILYEIGVITKLFDNFSVLQHVKTFILLEILFQNSMNILKSDIFSSILNNIFNQNIVRFKLIIQNLKEPPLSKFKKIEKFDRSELGKLIGKGANGKVYELHYNFGGVEKHCAVKEIKVDKYRVGAVLKEIESTALSQSPFTVGIYGYFEDEKNNFLYIFLEYCPNGNLFDIINKEKMKSFDEFFSYAFGVVHCTHDIHSNPKGALIHRDIKASNFLVDKNNLVKIGDFGTARFDCTLNLSSLKNGAGTVCFQAPEASRGKATIQSDIYSLGVVLFELCGAIPYKNYNYFFPFGDLKYLRVASAVSNYLRPILHPVIPQPLSDLIYSMLNHNEYDRPTSFEVFQKLKKVQEDYESNKEEWNSIFNTIDMKEDQQFHHERQEKVALMIKKKYLLTRPITESLVNHYDNIVFNIDYSISLNF